MARITLDLKRSIEQNAGDYFERAKKMKKKIEGAKKAVFDQKKKLLQMEKEAPKEEIKDMKVERKKQWYEKFRWFMSSEGFLCVGGRDSTTNEIIIKKHAEKNDIIFHTDMAGSPFVVLKCQKLQDKSILEHAQEPKFLTIKNKINSPTEKTLQEVADFTAVHSKGWKLGMSTLEVFWVTPEQVTKEANAGEYLTKGAFMIRGKTNYMTPTMNYAVGIYEGALMGGPIDAVKQNCKDFVEIAQGNEKTSDVAKIIQKSLGGNLDEIISILPPGCKIKKQ